MSPSWLTGGVGEFIVPGFHPIAGHFQVLASIVVDVMYVRY
jgi:hypothetical protein